jgi:hypothetical protein
LHELAERASLPIRSPDELRELLASAGPTMDLRGETMDVADAVRLVPAYYFPIGSKADLVAKLQDLAVGLGHDEGAVVREWMERTGSPAGATPASGQLTGWS